MIESVITAVTATGPAARNIPDAPRRARSSGRRTCGKQGIRSVIAEAMDMATAGTDAMYVTMGIDMRERGHDPTPLPSG